MRVRAVGLLAAAMTVALVGCKPTKPQPVAQSQAFECTGDAQTWVVPAGVTAAAFYAYGAQGGTGQDATAPGGTGSAAVAEMAVTPSEAIQVNVGCRGEDGDVADFGAGGFNGGGDGSVGAGPGPGGGGGGGASDVRRGGSGLDARVVVAAGGGGSGGRSGGGGGGAGGYPDGFGGGDGLFGPGGGGATQTAGGTGCNGGCHGAIGEGGDSPTDNEGGGGGGGWFGGGGGFLNGGGGGGSGFGPPDAEFANGVWEGDGVVIVVWFV